MSELLGALKALNAEIDELQHEQQKPTANVSFKTRLQFPASFSKNSTLAAGKLGWSALVGVSHLSRIPRNGASLCCQLISILEGGSVQKTLDLDKLIANVSVKLFSSSHAIDDDTSGCLQFLAKSFERLQKAFTDEDEGLVDDMKRRLSLQLSLIEGIQFKLDIPDDNLVLKQCYSIALDGLLKLMLTRRDTVSGLDDLIECYCATSTSSVMKLLSWCSKLESSMTNNEWILWCRVISKFDGSWQYYRKRKIEQYWKGPIELIAPLKHFPMELIEQSQKTSQCFALTGLLERAATDGDFLLLAQLVDAYSWSGPSAIELKELLKVLDVLRGDFYRLVKIDAAIRFLSSLNCALLQIKLPAKYASSWSTQLLKSLVDAKRTAKECFSTAIELLLSGALEEEFKEKSLKAAAQTISRSSNVKLLERILEVDSALLVIVLDHFFEGVSNEFMTVVNEAVIQSDDECLLKAWVRALSLQSNIHSLPSAIPFVAIKAITQFMLDDVKADRYLEAACLKMTETERLFTQAYLSLLNPRRRPPLQCPNFPILEAIKSNSQLKGPIVIEFDAQLDAHFYYLQLCLKREDFMAELTALKEASPAFLPLYQLFTQLLCSMHNRHTGPLHQLYLSGDHKAALKRGYETLKRLLTPAPFDFLQVCTYLHRLACVCGALNEASWFLKQIGDKAAGGTGLFEGLKRDFEKLSCRDNCFDQEGIEAILESDRFAPFVHEQAILRDLKQQRRSLPKLSYFCTGIDRKAANIPTNNSSYTLDYFNVQQAKIDLHLAACSDGSSQLLFKLFHRALGYPFQLNPSSSTLGIMGDWALNAVWILSSCSDDTFLLFRIPIDSRSLLLSIGECAQISQANTATLKNTLEIANDPSLRADWWRRRKELDAQLEALVKSLDSQLFSDFAGFFLPTSGDCPVKATNLIHELKTRAQLEISSGLAEKLVQLGSFPKRPAVELLLKMARKPINDEAISAVRKGFENALELGSIFYDSPNSTAESKQLNLLLDKTLCTLPWESFPSLQSKASFRRVLIDSAPERSLLQSVFYIINPSGDLIKTQARFKDLFESQSNWKGIVGRRPSSEEFFGGIGGEFDLFIYFGHAGGELYAPLHEWKQRSKNNTKTAAAAALLVGCSSGKIKINGIFTPQSSVFHYLDNESPLVLAALWDVTDKDIDNYIKAVLENSGLLQNEATLQAINQEAHASRGICYLKALNGFAPIVYGPYIK